MSSHRAACSCGQLTAECEGEPVRVSVCHCLACQRRTGSVFGAQARWPRDKVRVSGVSSEWVRVGDEGHRIHFHFCPTCGATVHYEIEDMGEVVAIPLGAFADPSLPGPSYSVYESRKHRWVSMPVDIEHHD